ncbi:MAG: alpha/beta hydrolase-fold protein [Anaerolineales bacterium]
MPINYQLALKHGNPLIEGDQVTIVWQGKQPPLFICDLYDWLEHPIEMEQADRSTWFHTMKLRPDAYLEYAFLDAETGERPADPLNPRRWVPNGFGEVNYYFYMPEAHPHPLTRRTAEVPRGEVTRHVIETHPYGAGTLRQVYLYRPAADGPVPLLVVYDGNDYVHRGRLPVILDNLLAQERIRPIAAAMVGNHKGARFLEYGGSEVTTGLLTERVLPLAYTHLDLVDLDRFPGAFGILGASMGGLMSTYTGWRLPQIFGHVISQSGAYSIRGHTFPIFDMIAYQPLPPIRLWMDIGLYEYLLDTNRSLHQLLAHQGFVHGYYEYPGGHNYTAWRNNLWRSLEYMFGSGSTAQTNVR